MLDVKSIGFLVALTLTVSGYAQSRTASAFGTAVEEHVHRSFEVATVKPVAKCTLRPVVVLTPSGRLSVGCQPLAVFVRLAYLPRIQEGNVTGGPKWGQSDLYDIVAQLDEADMQGWNTMTHGEELEAVKPYLRQLLAERFSLRTHTEMQTADVYAVVQAKGGARLREVAPPPSADSEHGDSTDAPAGGFQITKNRLIARAVQIPNLLWLFAGRSGYEDAPAVNRTGLQGYYDFEMALPDFQDKAEFERQMKIQLGLQIERQKVPLTTVVIDQAEKPTPN